jgi:recombination protein RecT
MPQKSSVPEGVVSSKGQNTSTSQPKNKEVIQAELTQNAASKSGNAPAVSWRQYIENNRSEIQSILPKTLAKNNGAERIVKLTLTTLRRRPELMTCSPESVIGCLIETSMLGLEPESPLGHAHLVPFNDKNTGQTECTFVVGYRGLITLAYRSGVVESIFPNVVYTDDQFEAEYGTNDILRHKVMSEDFSDSNVRYFYAKAKIKNAGTIFIVWPKSMVIEHGKKYSKTFASASSPWQTSFQAMGKKTMIRQLVDYLPRSAEDESSKSLHRALELDEKPINFSNFKDQDVI